MMNTKRYYSNKMLKKARKKSMKNGKMVNRNKITKKTDLKQKIYRIKFIAVLVLTLIASTLLAKTLIDIKYNADLIAATQITTEIVEERLIDESLGYYDLNNNFVLNNNTVEDYDKLELDNASLGTLYVYKKAMNNSTEFDKLTEAADNKTIDELNPNEYYKEATKEIVEAYRNDNINELVYNTIHNEKILKR